MPALPADVAKYTNDGVVVSSDPADSAAILLLYPDARDTGDTELEMFFDTPADAQALIDEKFALLSQINPPHEGIEVAESLGLGTAIPIDPVVPSFTILDQRRVLEAQVRTRMYAHELGSDRYSVEVLG